MNVPEQNIDQIERDRLMLECLPLVRSIAARVAESLPVQVEVDELVHAGIIALFDAAITYRGGMQASFQTYARQRIKGAILNSLCQECGDAASNWKRLRSMWLLSWNATELSTHSRKKWAWIPRDSGGIIIELRMLGPQSSTEPAEISK